MFPCTKCGLCCQNVHLNDLYKNLDRGDGVCKNLTEFMTCGTYDNRPIMCRIDEAYDTIFSQHISRQAYYKLNADFCYHLQIIAEVPVDKRIDLLNLY